MKTRKIGMEKPAPLPQMKQMYTTHTQENSTGRPVKKKIHIFPDLNSETLIYLGALYDDGFYIHSGKISP